MCLSLIDNGWEKVGLSVLRDICYTESNQILEVRIMDPILLELSARLAEVGVKNTAASVSSAIRSLKAGRDKDKTISGLTDIISELIDDKQEAELIAKSYRDELVAQKLSEEDLSYVVDTVLPALKDFLSRMADDDNPEEVEKMDETIKKLEALEPLLSVNTLTVLQTLGFNFRKGIGEPLTELTRNAISGKQKENQTHFNELVYERDIEYFKLLQDEEAFERFLSLK